MTDCFRVKISYWEITGRVETSDTVEDKNKNVYIITGQLKLKHICAVFGGHDVLLSPVRHFFGGGRVRGGRVPPVPRGIYATVCADRAGVYIGRL